MPRGVSRPRIEPVINRLGLASDKATNLSGGSRRRAELARVLLHQPLGTRIMFLGARAPTGRTA
jgi:ABC-type multidrug transport system ATPase subunit